MGTGPWSRNAIGTLRLLANSSACAAATLAALYLGTAQVYGGVSTAAGTVIGDPIYAPVPQSTSATLIEVNGPGVLLVLALPIIFTAIPLALRPSRWHRLAEVAAVVLLAMFVILGVASLGMFFVPAALLAAAAAVLGRRERPADVSDQPELT
jgi:hypothetical protein